MSFFKPGLRGFLKVIGVQNQLLITFAKELLHINPIQHTQNLLTFNQNENDARENKTDS